MLLYHGTSFRHLEQILIKGICPRGKSVSNWEKFPSHKQMVYLTTAYPLYFAINTLQDNESQAVVIEIDSDKLSESKLYPDEDFIAQVLSHKEKISLENAQAYVLKNINKFQADWENSITHLGNVSYKGKVPVSAITRYCVFDVSKQPDMAMLGLDPMISLMNYKFCKEKYTGLVSWLFGDADRIPDTFSDSWHSTTEPMPDFIRQRKEYMDKCYQNREGIRVEYVNYK